MHKLNIYLGLIVIYFFVTQIISAQSIDKAVIDGFYLRNLSPYNTGGRIADIAVDPKNRSI